MSNNNSNNIYNILETLEALAPKQEPIQQPAKVYENVEARGSVKEGVARIEAKLAEAFATEKAKNPFAVGMAVAKKKAGIEQTPAHDLPKKVVTKAHEIGKKINAEECMECGMPMESCSCEHEHMDEDKKHTGTYGTEYYKSKDFTGDDEDDKDSKKSKKDKGEKKTRGRPKKAEGEKSSDKLPFSSKHKMPHDLFGRVSDKAHDKAKADKGKDKVKGKAQSASESKLAQRFNAIMEGRMIDESGETLEHILNRFKHEVKQFEQGHDMDEDLYHALYDYYLDNGEMPYGTAKARTGDPYEWISDRLNQELTTDEAFTPQQKMQIPAYQRKATGDADWMIKQGDLDAVKADNISSREGLAKLARDTGISHDSDIGEDVTMESELNELAKLAGLKIADEGNAFTGKLAKTEKGDEFDLDGKTYKDTSNLDEGTCPTCNAKPCACNEGNEFSGALAKAKMQHKDSFEVDGKEYPVKESVTTLKDIASLAGIATEGKDYGDTDFEEPAKLDNTPEEEIEDADVMLKGGDGEVAGKEKKMSKNGAARFSDNPMESLSRSLMKQYESIKIQK